MAFKIEAFQNRYLPPGQARVDAILSVTAGDDAGAGPTASQLVVGFIIDKSGSMAGDRILGVKQAVAKAIGMLDERAWFFVVAFDSSAQIVVKEMQASVANKAQATRIIAGLGAGGGTAMSTGLTAALDIFGRAPDAIREAIFLTDGKNESEGPDKVKMALERCSGVFECDCWGVGTDWRVGEVQEIASGLLGKASLIPAPEGIATAFASAMQQASRKAVRDVRLRLWTPQGATLAFVKQVNPTIEELTNKATTVSPQVREYQTGAWGAGEARDFHLAVDVRAAGAGEEMLAARPSIVYQTWSGSGWVEKEDKAPEARLFASWTTDDSLSSRIDHHVAHYTGQDELAQAIQAGLEHRARGEEAAATQLLGKAVQIAHTSGNADMTHRLTKVVDVIDPSAGTVRLKKDAAKAATMDLELESRTTKRVKKS
jgi:von Willebrand factor type A C-terminal domain/von Willebrand factor type A domain